MSAAHCLPLRRIPLDLIRPGVHQARRSFDADALAELAASIRAHGVVQPVVVRSAAAGYELLAGERRWRAAQLAGLAELPAIVRDDLAEDEALVVGLIENLQRESLSAIETATGLKRLAETFGLTHEQIGQRIGKSREYVTNFLRLLQLHPDVQAMVGDGRLSSGHAKVLAGLPLEEQTRWGWIAIREGLAVRALERRIAATRRALSPAAPRKDGDWQRLETRLADHLGCPVGLDADVAGRGELRLRFHSLDELDGLLRRLGCDPGA